MRSREGEFLETVPFVEEGGSPIGTLIEGSHEGRLVFDLKNLTAEALVTPTEEFFIRTRYPDLLRHEGPWAIEVHGHVGSEQALLLDDLVEDVEPMGKQVLECSGNSKFREFGLLSCAEWAGVPMASVLERVGPTLRATALLVSGHDEHSDFKTKRVEGASWIFPLEELSKAGAYLATEMNGTPLTPDHGAPVRLVVPNWYGCSCIKWVNELKLVDDDEPSTAQMREFAGRTHQDGVPLLAREFRPATMDQSGMVIRVEKWRESDGLSYRVWGLLWGGEKTTDRFRIRFREDLPPVPIESCRQETNSAWTLWSHTWRPQAPGRYGIQVLVDDPEIRTRRLDRGFYTRFLDIQDA